MWSSDTLSDDDSSEVFGTETTVGRRLSESGELAPPPTSTLPPVPPPILAPSARQNSSSDHILYVSGGQSCPDGYVAPTIEWCQLNAREEGLEFMVRAAPPLDIIPMCTRRTRLDIYGRYIEEYAGSYLQSEACPSYDGVHNC
eukprot:1190209-Pleurochrysis_carterae.AAC.1